VKLMLNMLLLLLNLHVWIVVIWTFVDFCSIWWKIMLLLLLIVDELMIEWCGCCYEMLCCWIMPRVLEIPWVYSCLVYCCCVWLSFGGFWWKWTRRWFWVELVFLIRCCCCFECPSIFVIKCLSFGIEFGVRGSKLGILGEKWCKTRKNRRKLAWSSLGASFVWKKLARS